MDPKLLKYEEKQVRKAQKKEAKYEAKHAYDFSSSSESSEAEFERELGHTYYPQDDYEPQYSHHRRLKHHLTIPHDDHYRTKHDYYDHYDHRREEEEPLLHRYEDDDSYDYGHRLRYVRHERSRSPGGWGLRESHSAHGGEDDYSYHHEGLERQHEAPYHYGRHYDYDRHRWRRGRHYQNDESA